jgi:hypothetical protein
LWRYATSRINHSKETRHEKEEELKKKKKKMEDKYRREVVPQGSRNVQPYPWLEVTTLPRLPIPTIEETARRYDEYLQPLLAEASPSDLARTRRFVADFVQHDAAGLQADLHNLARVSPTSWLEGWWDTGYLEFRVPSFINVNPFFVFKADPTNPAQVPSLNRFYL